eukprot:TRINITY_DN3799_c0_g1_i1.p1 TRINITY_DN3799_c0_g1~~TRINITY_DN3799_c0_g1_i1.p1  ORF type:complete len:340 (-),score=77.75 TRINITY_DN3799_c0_g1_i1:46-987(-)
MDYFLKGMNYYLESDGVKKDVKKTIDYYEKAIKLGCIPALFSLSQIYYVFDKNIPLVLSNCKKILKADRVHKHDAAYLIGKIYLSDKFGFKNLKKGLEMMEYAKKEIYDAYVEIAHNYTLNEMDNKQERKKSLEYLQIALKNKEKIQDQKLVGDAYFYMGELHHDETEDFDYEKSIHYFKLCTETESHLKDHGFFMIGVIHYEKNNLIRNKEDTEKAIHYLQIAANRGIKIAEELIRHTKDPNYKIKEESMENERKEHKERKEYLDDKINYCSLCKKQENLKYCARCKKVKYCSRDCQVKHWSQHKIDCVPLN